MENFVACSLILGLKNRSILPWNLFFVATFSLFIFWSVLLVPQKSRSKEISGGWNWWLPGLQVGRPLFPPWTSWWKCRGKVTKGEGKMGLGTRRKKTTPGAGGGGDFKTSGCPCLKFMEIFPPKNLERLNSGAWNWRYSLAPVSKCVSEKLGKPVTFLKVSRSFFTALFWGGKCLGKCDLDYFFWRSMNLEMTSWTFCFLLFWCFGRGISYGIGHLDQTYTKYNTMVCTTIWILHTIHAAYASSIQCICVYNYIISLYLSIFCVADVL